MTPGQSLYANWAVGTSAPRDVLLCGQIPASISPTPNPDIDHDHETQMRNSQAEVAAKHSLENRVYGIKAEEEPRNLEKRSSKCHLLINNLKEISSEHKTKMPLDWRSHRSSWGEGWKPSALTVQWQEIHHLKCPEHRSHMTHPTHQVNMPR